MHRKSHSPNISTFRAYKLGAASLIPLAAAVGFRTAALGATISDALTALDIQEVVDQVVIARVRSSDNPKHGTKEERREQAMQNVDDSLRVH